MQWQGEQGSHLMLMQDFLKATSDAFETLNKAIRNMRYPMERLQRERQLLQHCDDYLNDKNDNDGWGYAAFSYVSDHWGKELTLTDVEKFLRGVDGRILANRCQCVMWVNAHDCPKRSQTCVGSSE
jgi:hypothetical protein